jgi:pimeloyl-ACP methyl ester carboxylesterase
MQPFLDFGGLGPLLQLAPANGFPPEVYTPLAECLSERFHVVGYRPLPLREHHDPTRFTSWHELATALLADGDVALSPEPLLGVGHSLGGILTLYAALYRPQRFRAVALIDPVFLPRHTLPLIWLLRKLGREHRFPLAQGAARRRDRFATREEAYQRYHGRGIFADFVPQALAQYIEHGFRPDGDSFTLSWSRAWESRIFANVPIDTWDAVTKLRVPLLIMRGSRSDLLVDRSWAQLQARLPDARFITLEGGHMVPMERPIEVAEAIIDFLATAYGRATTRYMAHS